MGITNPKLAFIHVDIKVEVERMKIVIQGVQKMDRENIEYRFNSNNKYLSSHCEHIISTKCMIMSVNFKFIDQRVLEYTSLNKNVRYCDFVVFVTGL